MSASDGRVVTNFITQALNGDPITVYGDGDQTRSFCYVDDLICGIVAMIDSAEPGPVNLGNPEEFTVGEFAELVLEITGSASPIEYRPLPVDDPTRRCPAIARARKSLGWQPEVPVAEGISRTADWLRSRPGEVRLASAGRSPASAAPYRPSMFPFRVEGPGESGGSRGSGGPTGLRRSDAAWRPSGRRSWPARPEAEAGQVQSRIEQR